RVDGVGVQRAAKCSVGGVKADLRRRGETGTDVDEKIALGADAGGANAREPIAEACGAELMAALLFRQPLKPSSIKPAAVKIDRNRTVLGSGDIDSAIVLVDKMQGAYLPFAARHGANEFAFLVKVVDMPPTGALAGKEE